MIRRAIQIYSFLNLKQINMKEGAERHKEIYKETREAQETLAILPWNLLHKDSARNFLIAV